MGTALMTSDEAVQITLTALIRAIYTGENKTRLIFSRINGPIMISIKFILEISIISQIWRCENKVTDHKGLNREIVLILKRPNAIVFNENSSNYFLSLKCRLFQLCFFIK